MSPARTAGVAFVWPAARFASETARAAITSGSLATRTGKPIGETLLSQRRYWTGSGLSRPYRSL